MVGGVAPLVDCNVHLWDQTANPIFWLTDRTLVRDMIGNYDSLPDTYTLADYRREVAGHDVRGIVWSDAGADDPIAAAAWVQRQCEELDMPGALVTLGDPADHGFPELVERFRALPLARSVRVRLVPALAQGAPDRTLLDDEGAMANLELLAKHELVATLEATGDQLDVVADLARALPALRIVVDHFGWPENPNEEELGPHRARLVSDCRDAQHRHAHRCDRDDLRRLDDRPRAPMAARGDRHVRTGTLHARVRYANRAPAVRLRSALRRLPRHLLRSHRWRP